MRVSVLVSTVMVLSMVGCGVPEGKPAATAVGTTKGTAATALIGAQGGVVRSGDGRLKVDIPAGALEADTTISVQALENTAHGRLGDGYRLLPEGTTFKQPVSLTFSYTDASVEGRAEAALGVAFQTAEGFWQWVDGPVIDEGANTVTVKTTHFSDWSLVSGFMLRPVVAKVGLGDALELRVFFCYQAPTDGELVQLAYACGDTNTDPELHPLAVPQGRISKWTVNGVTNGDNKVGRLTISSNVGGLATYTAPNSTPSQNPVAVGAQIAWKGTETMTVFSNITVGQPTGYAGTFTFRLVDGTSSTTSGTGEVVWKLKSESGGTRHFTPEGTLTVDYLGANCEPVNFTTPIVTTNPVGLSVYSDTGVGVNPYASRYFFSVMGNATVPVRCNGTTSDRVISFAFNTQGCNATPSVIGTGWTDLARLADTFHCDERPVTDVSWTFDQR